MSEGEFIAEQRGITKADYGDTEFLTVCRDAYRVSFGPSFVDGQFRVVVKDWPECAMPSQTRWVMAVVRNEPMSALAPDKTASHPANIELSEGYAEAMDRTLFASFQRLAVAVDRCKKALLDAIFSTRKPNKALAYPLCDGHGEIDWKSLKHEVEQIAAQFRKAFHTRCRGD